MYCPIIINNSGNSNCFWWKSNCGFERSLLGISKAFDKVWHDGIVFKLQTYGAEGELLSLLKNYLENREQRVVLNGQTSEWRKIMSGIPQAWILGPLLFLIYINYLTDGINSFCKIFADDISLFSKGLWHT